ncbi:trypsin-like peptidase domain-containing protein [Paraburkholderia phenoliruptrix]|uniref:Uncharacterized protein n=2 Tax=Paraburkholderia phenoliruptrix TaxID=252970 RepID=K0E139_9BURK|nr:trypsin-like peptidase domain-containing protein [Paraburkholderia phenoliruptrix]AFT90153.1 hypothetical protein BUPH_05118 [Paraburkholderia phenoliruptrix BR3459a]CAB4053028.1 hypothetical protein LMG9964_06719 [Paraburkholderia phenoliruptrix]
MANDDHPPALTFEPEDIERVIQDPIKRVQAAEALAQIRVGREGELPSPEALDAAADMVGEERAQFWVATLARKGGLATFVAALRMRGLATEKEELDHKELMFDDRLLRGFIDRANTFRCMVRVAGIVKGSGLLVGPSSVLTAWHVIAVVGPSEVAEVQPDVDVVLTDGRAIPAIILPGASPCGDVEWPPEGGRAPKTDEEVLDRHDVALLRLKQPAGIHLAFATLATPPYAYRGPAGVVLISYPDGEWRGLEFAKLRKLRNMTARWGYDPLGARGGSSGGGCFDTSFSLAGIHQGRAEGARRLVPLICFDSIVRKVIADDETPEKLWSLDGTPESGLVVGRDTFFIGYHAAMRGPVRARGVWVRRVDLTHDMAGLPFSFEMLDKLVARRPDTRLIRVSFDALVPDLPNEIARRAADARIQVQLPEAMSGVGTDQTEPEAVVADRSRRLAQSLDEKARELGILLWIFFDHPAVVFGDESRWALTAFVDQALRLERLRIMLAGYEAIQMPGDLFDTRVDAEGEGAPGLFVEYLIDVNATDVRNLIESAAKDMHRTISPERVTEWTNEALKDLNPVNGRYDSVLRTEIASRLQPRLKQLLDEEGAE